MAEAGAWPSRPTPPIASVVATHVVAQFRELVRYPAFVIPTLSLPALFFLVFGVPDASTPAAANRITTSYLAFAVLGVMLFQFGVGVSASRHWSWERFLRMLGVSPSVRFAARFGSGLVFLFLATLPVVVLAETATAVSLSPARWLSFGVTLVAGSVPFALLGVAIGYMVEPKAAVPVANLVYLGLSYAGGLFQKPSSLPDVIRPVSEVSPTRLWAELLQSSGRSQPLPWENVLGLLAYAVAFFLLARWGFQRDEEKIYR